MATLNFTIAYSSTLLGLEGQEPSTTVYAEDLENCSTCVSLKESCWACLSTEQQVFSDSGLTSPVADGYYRVEYSTGDPNAIWHIIEGYPQSEGFFN
jgi:hypothetical protein